MNTRSKWILFCSFLCAITLMIGCSGQEAEAPSNAGQVFPTATEVVLVGETQPSAHPTQTPAPPTETPTTTPIPPTPTKALAEGPDGWILYENDDFHIAVFHPAGWVPSVETADDGTMGIQITDGEHGTLTIHETPSLKDSTPKEWADVMIQLTDASQPGGFDFEHLGPVTTLDGGKGYAFRLQSTQFSIGALKGVVVYDETAFELTGMLLGWEDDEDVFAVYQGILETIQNR